MFVLVRMKLRHHVNTTSEACQELCDMCSKFKFGMLQVRGNEISLR